ncbi:hypothetical protein KDA23_01170 [Candidatus Saccharibacteria bacterium]|nr:hypothetical protein [Candidatus Saccharibacteria bacterium]
MVYPVRVVGHTGATRTSPADLYAASRDYHLFDDVIGVLGRGLELAASRAGHVYSSRKVSRLADCQNDVLMQFANWREDQKFSV